MFWKEIVYPEDRHIADQMYEDVLAGIASKREYRVLDREGNIRWFYNCGYPVFDAKGKVVQINGVTVDITKRKQAEIALRNSEELYRLLQTSLDRFSRDVFGVMKVSELEERFIQEIQEVVDDSFVGILEVGPFIKIK